MIPSMALRIRENPDAHRYEALEDDGPVLGYVEYVDHRDVRILFHTEVADMAEGQGIGSELARAVLDAVTGAGMSVRVTCPFLVAWVERHPEYEGKVTLR